MSFLSLVEHYYVVIVLTVSSDSMLSCIVRAGWVFTARQSYGGSGHTCR